MPTNIDSLSIELSASAGKAASGIDGLISKLERLSSASGHAGSNTQGAAQKIQEFGDMAKNSKVEEVAESLEDYSSAASRAGRITDGLKQAWSALTSPVKAAISGVKGFVAQLARVAKYRFLRYIIKSIVQGFKEGVTNLYSWSKTVDHTFSNSMDKISTSLLYLKNSLGAMVAPLVNALAPALDFIIDKVVDVFNWFNQLFAMLAGQDTYTVAKKVASVWDDSSEKAKNNAKSAADDIKRTILGFDEINKLTKQQSSSSSSSSGSGKSSTDASVMFENRKLTGGFAGFSNAVENAMRSTLSRITLLVSGASLAIGAVLTFSGANTPLGLGLMAAGASGLATTLLLNWNGIDGNIKRTVASIELALGGASLAVGAVLAFSGAKPALGIALMAMGAASIASSISLQWGSGLTNPVQNVITNIEGILSGAFLALGALLAFSGGSIPIGIAMMVAGATGLISTINWNILPEKLREPIAAVTTLVSGASIGLGAILAFTGHIGVGIPLLAMGAGGLVSAMNVNWKYMENALSGPIGTVTALISGAALVLGAVLTFTGHVGIGIPLLAMGATGIASAATVNWNYLQNKLEGPIGTVTGIISGASLVLGILCLIGGLVPLGLGLIFAGAAGLATTIAANWDNLKQLGEDAIKKVKEGWDSLKDKAFELKAKITSKAQDLWNGLKRGWNQVTDKVAEFNVKAKQTASTLWETLKSDWNDSTVGKYMNMTVKPLLQSAWDTVKEAWEKSSVGKFVELKVKPVLSTVGGTIVDSLKEAGSNFWNWLFPTAVAEDGSYTATVKLAVDKTGTTNFVTEFDTAVQTTCDAIRRKWNDITSWTTSAWGSIEETVGEKWDNIKTTVNRATGSVGTWVKDTWGDIKSNTQTTWDNVKLNAVNAWITLKTNASSVFGNIKTNILNAWGESGAKGVLNGFIGWVNKVFSIDWETAWTGVINQFGDIFGLLKDKAKAPINAVIQFLNNLIAKVEYSINKIVRGINSSLHIDVQIPNPFGGWLLDYHWKPSLQGVTFGRIEYLAKGAILNAPTMLTPNVMGGEAGSEAVLPLETHTEWMDTLADRINERDGAARRADEQLIGLMRELLSEMRRFNEKEFSANITTGDINRAQARSNRRAGTTIVPVGG